MSILVHLYMLKLAFFVIIVLPKRKCKKGWKIFYNSLYKSLFFNDLIIILIEGYMEILLSAILILNVPNNNQDNTTPMIGYGFMFLIATLVFVPSLQLWIFIKPKRVLYQHHFYQRFEFLRKNLRR